MRLSLISYESLCETIVQNIINGLFLSNIVVLFTATIHMYTRMSSMRIRR